MQHKICVVLNSRTERVYAKFQLIFSLLHLTEEMICNALEMGGLDLATAKKYVLPDEGVMFLMGTKL